ncbi:MAG TPA: magnesium chelatase subunit D family protein [Pirellulaceae bacterium]|nr:magnesium chelatase subunit D family protein [Pirellulaceae bacterium]
MRYPFTALVGQEQLKTALVLNAIDPGLGGVLICGEKGTAKSTAARALADLLPPLQVRKDCPYHSGPDDPLPFANDPDATATDEAPRAITEIAVPFVELPLGATEDRVVGAIDLERTLRERQRAFQPGLLASANRGILYVDEINLLADHLVDLLLDAAASGVNIVQRDGIEVIHPARFLLIGTMNPEEGQLRPQLLDRFGLMVEVAASRDPAARVEVLRRRMAFEADPASFCAAWRSEQERLGRRIVAARGRLAAVSVTHELLHLICRICCEMEVDGMRADIAMQKTARALAAFHDRREATDEDVRQAAELVLPHRRRRQPFEKPGFDPQQLDDLFPSPADMSRNPSQCGSDHDSAEDTAPVAEADHDREASNDESALNAKSPSSKTTTFAPTSMDTVPPIRVASCEILAPTTRGRRNPTLHARSGRFVRAVLDPAPTNWAVGATLRSAALRGTNEDGELDVRPADLHRQELAGEAGTLVLFVVDASGSMAARRRMEMVKGTALSLLMDAYHQRDRVGVIAFRGPQAALLLPPTNSLDLARDAFDQLPTGGRTPLAHALVLATETVRRERRSAPDLLVLAVVLTDGKGNVALPGSNGLPWEQTVQAATMLARENVAALVLDTDQEFVRVGRARELAGFFGGEYRPLEQLSANSLALEIRQRCGPPSQAARSRRASP